MNMESADRVDSQTKRQGLETLECKLIRVQNSHFCSVNKLRVTVSSAQVRKWMA
jgi:hypothetical protein